MGGKDSENLTLLRQAMCKVFTVKNECFLLHSQSLRLIPGSLPDGAARTFLPPCATAKIRTHVSRVVPTWDLKKDTLPTELLRYTKTNVEPLSFFDTGPSPTSPLCFNQLLNDLATI